MRQRLHPLRKQLPTDPSWKIRGLVLAAICLILLLWKLPGWQATHTAGTTTANRFDREDEARKTLAQIIGGIVILGGLYTSLRTFGLSRESQITDRFTKAIEQLGRTDGTKPNIEVRLGAIYALERIALDSPRDHWTIMEILTAYVRRNAQLDPNRPHVEGETPWTDIQAVLTVLGRRKTGPGRESADHCLDLTNTFLEGADLHKADLRRAKLTHANLRRVDLRQARLDSADLRRTNLRNAKLASADLQRAKLFGADLRGAEGLTPLQIQAANKWKDAIYTPLFRQKLGLISEDTESSL